MKPEKVRYRFLIHPAGGDTVEFQKVEAGPFTPAEAAMFGHAETVRYTVLHGGTWECLYTPIVDDPKPNTWSTVALVVSISLAIGYLIGWFLGKAFQ
jgi:hypothetical protein